MQIMTLEESLDNVTTNSTLKAHTFGLGLGIGFGDWAIGEVLIGFFDFIIVWN